MTTSRPSILSLSRRLVLATDLDGTFLGGGVAGRQALYQWLRLQRERELLTLIFVTGRDLPFIRGLVSDGFVPRPDYVIGDVGTTIAGGPGLEPLPELERHIAARWNDAGPCLRALLADEPGLREQDTPFRYRLSYWYEPALLSPGTLPKIEAAGYDGLLSAGMYLDVLPRGISKGPTLRHLLAHLRIAPDDVLTAGDTLNDLSLFETGLRGVAVGNSEPALLERLQALESEEPEESEEVHEVAPCRIYRSPQHGAAGILDAMHHHGFVERGYFAQSL